MVAIGFSIDHAHPKTERLYLLRFSRSVRLMSSDRAAPNELDCSMFTSNTIR